MFNAPELREVMQRHLQADANVAMLSTVFRTYYLVRRFVPISFRQLIQRYRRVEANERWCFPDKFIQELVELVERHSHAGPVVHPWPEGRSFAVVLTHDLETQDGCAVIPKLAEMEEELGFRSSWNIVPYKYRVDRGLLRDLRNRGFEIGIHGYNHDGKLYSSWRTFKCRAKAINRALKEYHAVGFRSPMVHRNLAWLQELEIEYDASCFDIDPYQAMPGGVGSIWPFRVGKFIELPYTLPQDHTLFVARGEQDCQTWRRKLDFIARNHGMALLLTHPDYLTTDRYRSLYREFLTIARDRGGFWHSLPRDVAAWWGSREQSQRESGRREFNDTSVPPGRVRQAQITVKDGALVFNERSNAALKECSDEPKQASASSDSC